MARTLPPSEHETSFQAVLGAVFHQRRRDQGIPQSQVAEGARVAQSTWSRIEQGTRSPSPDQLLGAAQALGTTVSDLTAQAERLLERLRAGGVHFRPTRTAAAEKDSTLKWVAGAALLGLIVLLVSHE